MEASDLVRSYRAEPVERSWKDRFSREKIGRKNPSMWHAAGLDN